MFGEKIAILAIATGECQIRGENEPGKPGREGSGGRLEAFKGPERAEPLPYAYARLSPPMSALFCFSTCPDAATAERIAAALVGERLAACVNIVPGLRSVYRWNGAIERADEVLLLIKTQADRLQSLQDRLPQLHPYELPELVAVEIDHGLPAYLRWIADQTRTEPASE